VAVTPAPAASLKSATDNGRTVSAAATLAPIVNPPAAIQNRPLRGKEALVMTVREDTWVEIRLATSKDAESPLVARLLKAGATERFDVPEAVVLTIGNASGVDVSLRGFALDIKPTTKSNVARLNLK
jgi:cytoskeleton protein RodZ